MPSGEQRPHTLSATDSELGALEHSVLQMSDAVCDQLAKLLEILRRRQTKTLGAIIDGDAPIDALYSALELRVVGLLARNQPVARDLRQVLAAQRVGIELERIGDHVKRIAKQSLAMQPPPTAEMISRLLWLGGHAQALLGNSLQTYRHVESDQVERAWDDDALLDQMYRGLLAELLQRMREHGEWVSAGVGLVMIAKSLERIGDHATNIAEEARFVAVGQVVQGRRSD